jgi:hypothetical protein
MPSRQAQAHRMVYVINFDINPYVNVNVGKKNRTEHILTANNITREFILID